MTTKTKSTYSNLERLALIVFFVSLALYFVNILLGKASVKWGWDIFYLGNISEFLLLLFASISFIIAALHREASVGNKSE